MESTGGADLDAVRLNRLSSAKQSIELRLGGWAGPPSRQFGPEDIGYLNGFGPVTHRTAFLGTATNVLGGPDQLGVGIAMILAGDLPQTDRLGQGVAQESVLNRCLLIGC